MGQLRNRGFYLVCINEEAVSIRDYFNGIEGDTITVNLQYDLNEERWVEVYETLAEEKGCTSEEVMVTLKEQYNSDVVAMRNTHNRLSFEETTFTMQSEWVNFPLVDIIYEYTGRVTTEWEIWYVFEAESWKIYSPYEENVEVYPVMLLTRVEEEAESTDDRHFHYRYGDNAEELLAMEGWLPTMVYPWHSYQGLLELLKTHDRPADRPKINS